MYKLTVSDEPKNVSLLDTERDGVLEQLNPPQDTDIRS